MSTNIVYSTYSFSYFCAPLTCWFLNKNSLIQTEVLSNHQSYFAVGKYTRTLISILSKYTKQPFLTKLSTKALSGEIKVKISKVTVNSHFTTGTKIGADEPSPVHSLRAHLHSHHKGPSFIYHVLLIIFSTVDG